MLGSKFLGESVFAVRVGKLDRADSELPGTWVAQRRREADGAMYGGGVGSLLGKLSR